MKTYSRKTARRSQRGIVRSKVVVVSFSLYPEQWDHIRQRARELNLSQSEIVQILVDYDKNHGIARQEVLRRLNIHLPEAAAA